MQAPAMWTDPQWVGLVVSIFSVIVNLWTRLTVSELKRDIEKQVADTYVSLREYEPRIENLERAQLAMLAKAVSGE